MGDFTARRTVYKMVEVSLQQSGQRVGGFPQQGGVSTVEYLRPERRAKAVRGGQRLPSATILHLSVKGLYP